MRRMTTHVEEKGKKKWRNKGVLMRTLFSSFPKVFFAQKE